MIDSTAARRRHRRPRPWPSGPSSHDEQSPSLGVLDAPTWGAGERPARVPMDSRLARSLRTTLRGVNMSRLPYAQCGMPAIATEPAVIASQPFPPRSGRAPLSFGVEAPDAWSEIRLTPELVVTQAAYRVFGANH